MQKNATPPNIMTLAGSDSGGGAGIQADLKTITALGGFGVSVITALTAQHGAGVNGIFAPPADFALLQLRTLLEGFKISAAKTGMLCSAAIIDTLSDGLKAKDFPLVVDPVCLSQSGHRLLEENAVESIKQRLLPLADLVTPNRPEAELLSGLAISSPDDIAKAARILQGFGAKAVLIKGGHFAMSPDGTYIDWLCLPDSSDPIALPVPGVDTPNNHGTGCTLSAAIATYLGQGHELLEAIKKAQVYLRKGLAASFTPGIGAGPPNFMANFIAGGV